MADTTSRGFEPSPVPALPVDIRQLVSQYYRDVYRYAYRLSGCQADAEDLTQQTFLIAQTRLYQLREPHKAVRWLYAVLRSCFLKSASRPRLVSLDAAELEVPDSDSPPGVGAAIDREALQCALGELPQDYRLVVLMFYFEELSYKEIAEQLEIPIGTVMSRLARAKGRLREKLREERVVEHSGSRHVRVS